MINNNRVYLVSRECFLVRNFGGVSQNNVEVVGKELQNGYLSMTQELFKANDINE